VGGWGVVWRKASTKKGGEGGQALLIWGGLMWRLSDAWRAWVCGGRATECGCRPDSYGLAAIRGGAGQRKAAVTMHRAGGYPPAPPVGLQGLGGAESAGLIRGAWAFKG
jgi:hypothetical protein